MTEVELNCIRCGKTFRDNLLLYVRSKLEICYDCRQPTTMQRGIR